ncbi:hypothetical protein AKG34_21415 [Peribacillus butanolivorans]|uniref:CHC2 zinc finger domain-containing protein n=1 Tax=Peribacillus butanolivorans TaxID=421767 RepID=UPI0006A6DDD1|nr:CHC2 zinc finger domain-containing protein [Peribacillus butanolivorans]KON67381.1 hypothetical protein AKG34_21415 [Peribacillus butanolivorans]
MSNNIKEVIQQIKASVSLLEIVQEHVVMKKAGKNFQGLCPFHNEKTPSLFVNEQKGIWKCFGCGKSGDVINFFAEINNYNNKQSIKVLSNRLGLNNTGKYKKQVEELIKKRAADRENEKKFTAAMAMLINELEHTINILKEITSHFKKIEEVDAYSDIYHELSNLTYLYEQTEYISNSFEENEMYFKLKEEYLSYKPLLSYMGGMN